MNNTFLTESLFKLKNPFLEGTDAWPEGQTTVKTYTIAFAICAGVSYTTISNPNLVQLNVVCCILCCWCGSAITDSEEEIDEEDAPLGSMTSPKFNGSRSQSETLRAEYQQVDNTGV